MNENVKKIALNASAIALAIAMGLQAFVFGKSDIDTLKEQVVQLSKRIEKLESPARP